MNNNFNYIINIISVALSIYCLIAPLTGMTQDCSVQLSGQIVDKGTGIPLPYANVFLEEKEKGTIADSLGFFQLSQLCGGNYHLTFSHIGCEPEQLFLTIAKDTFITMHLHHHAELLDEVVVHGKNEEHAAQISSTIGKEVIERSSYKNLADVLENITGVSVLKNGSGISKPIIHGLYGNRVAILNNGIAQSGQQWGNDHAPEIDPATADHLSVVKGASALAYGGNSLGGVVLVEPDKIRKDPHLHGHINYAFQSNGFGNNLNAQMEKNGKWAAWRINGTLSRRGDTKAPDYFLTNTGKREANFAIQIEKKLSNKWFNDIYLSTFNTEIGVLRGSHISNLTDLEIAIGKEKPFFTNNTFSYAVNAPRQKVNHHLLKIASRYFINNGQVVKFTYGGQLNDRKEFDIRRGNRSDIPALSLQQYSHFFEGAYHHTFKNHLLLKSGVQFQLAENVNNPETGVSPLIPNYDAATTSAFAILQKDYHKWFYEVGARYDYKSLKVVTFTQTLPRMIERLSHQFNNYSFSTGIKYKMNETLKTNFNAGYMLRSPEVNELYSMGLHQGVSGIEEGQRDLTQEKSFKLVASVDWYIKNKIFIQALGYYQNIQDFIFLQPEKEFRLTIRGAFPVFTYKQTNARIYGTDLLFSFEPHQNIKWVFKYAKVNGRNISNNLPLINIPSDNLYSSLTLSLKDSKKFKQNNFSINGKYIYKQNDILPEQDFLSPPDGYFLMGMKMETNLQFHHSKIRFTLSIENLWNARYRDYLNRLRYFADDTGVNLIFNVHYSF